MFHLSRLRLCWSHVNTSTEIQKSQSRKTNLSSGVSGSLVCIKGSNRVQTTWTDLETGLKRCQMRAGHCVPPHGVSHRQAVEQGLLVKVSFRERSASSERQAESKETYSRCVLLRPKDFNFATKVMNLCTTF